MGVRSLKVTARHLNNAGCCYEYAIISVPRIAVVRPSFPMMTITSSMMMKIMSCLVGPVGAEVANQSNSGLQHSSTYSGHE